MLEIRNLVKIYSTKGGVAVRALDDVSVKFPEKGMVFLLGRSGSGKSTLLNVAGGLDKPNSGEVVVKGRSSKDFRDADFDSYRNTFIGFIFQEYNILNEFTVEQNIALALQLQNKPNDKKAVEALLEQVDLKGFGKRKPNTLSGGQKQRVAIARALIKEPEIIMADEPTGALDSNTGKQVFDTLKKLSKNKLVIVVSHDRDFARQYGDRIIELADGKIISDVSKDTAKPEMLSDNIQKISEDTISIKDTEKVTEEEVNRILSILKKSKGEAIITSGEETLVEIKKVCKVDQEGNREYFKETGEVNTRKYDGEKTKFIKSKLPFSHAFRMGASGLKTKPIRLIFTILLSVVAFGMFGVVSTLSLYDSAFSISQAFIKENNPSLSIYKENEYIDQQIKFDYESGEKKVEKEIVGYERALFGASEIAEKNKNGLDFAGVFSFSGDVRHGEERRSVYYVQGENRHNVDSTSDYFNVRTLLGFSDVGEDYLLRNGYTRIGNSRYPTSRSEIAISKYFAELMVSNVDFNLGRVENVIGKKVVFSNGNAIRGNEEFTIVGIYDVGSIDSKYDVLKEESSSLNGQGREQLKIALQDYLYSSLHTVAFVNEEFFNYYIEKFTPSSTDRIEIAKTISEGITYDIKEIDREILDSGIVAMYTEKNIAINADKFKFYDKNGNQMQFSLNDGETILSKQEFYSKRSEKFQQYIRDIFDLKVYNEAVFYDIVDKENELYDSVFYKEREELVDKWYSIVKYNEFIVTTASAIKERIGDSSSIPNYNSISEVIDIASNKDRGNGNETPLTKVQLEILESFVKQYGEQYVEQKMFEPYFAFMGNNAIEKGESEQYFYDILPNKEYTFFNISFYLSSGDFSSEEFEKIKNAVKKDFKTFTGKEMSNIQFKDLFAPVFPAETTEKLYYKNSAGETGELTVKGYYEIVANVDWGSYCPIVKQEFLEFKSNIIEGDKYANYNNKVYKNQAPLDAKYEVLISRTNNSQEQIHASLENGEHVRYHINGMLYQELYSFVSTISDLAQIFLILGIVFGVFAGLMLANFITVSISAKKKDIGILRAVGARGRDVFKIFFSEAGIISAICFVLATIGAGIASIILNNSLSKITTISLLNFGAVNILLILGVSLVVSLLATIFPVRSASKKSPVESIRSL